MRICGNCTLVAMTDSEQVLENSSTSSLIDQLQETLNQLETSKNASAYAIEWAEIEEHFRNLDVIFKKKFEELEVREEEYKEKEAKTCSSLAEKEAAVVLKELDLLDRLQELKDGAVAVIAEERAAHQPASLESTFEDDKKEIKVSSLIDNVSSPEDHSPQERRASVDHVAADCKPRPEIKRFCEQMNAKGLVTFIMENQKKVNAIRQELAIALESANKPAQMVLDSLEALHHPDEPAPAQSVDEMYGVHQGMRRSCSVLMDALAALLARVDPGAEHLLNPETKQHAKAIADQWKPELFTAGLVATHVNSLEAYLFLQLLSTFKISSEFDEEELYKLVPLVASRKLAPELCQSLGLAHKVPGIIDLLVNTGRHIDAVRFVHAFWLTEIFPPVPLLKSYLKDLRRNTQGKGGYLGAATGVQIDANTQELMALRAIIKCVQEYKLEADYPLGPLQKRRSQLEGLRSGRKRTGDFGKHQQSKKSRYGGKFRGPPAVSTSGQQAPPPFIHKTTYTGMMERYPHSALNPYEYQVPRQPAYGQPAVDQRMYYYPQDDRVASTSYNEAASTYGSYLSGGIHPSHQPYM